MSYLIYLVVPLLTNLVLQGVSDNILRSLNKALQQAATARRKVREAATTSILVANVRIALQQGPLFTTELFSSSTLEQATTVAYPYADRLMPQAKTPNARAHTTRSYQSRDPRRQTAPQVSRNRGTGQSRRPFRNQPYSRQSSDIPTSAPVRRSTRTQRQYTRGNRSRPYQNRRGRQPARSSQ